MFVVRKKSYSISEVGAVKALDESFKRFEVEAVKHLYMARTGLAKLFYFLLIVLLFGVMSYEIIKTISQFINSPVSSSLKVVNFAELALPQIYICASHRFTHEALKSNQSHVDLALKLNRQLSLLYNEDPSEWMTRKTGVEDVQFENLTFKDLKNLWLSFYLRSPKQIFRNNQYREALTVAAQFAISKFRPVFDPYFGICYTLNLTNMPQILEAQALTLFATLERHIFQVERHILSKVPTFRGFYVSFAEKLDPTNLANFLIVPANRLSKLGLRKLNISMLPEKQKCIQKTGLDLLVLNSSFSLKSCRLDCILSLIVSKCQCLPGIDDIFLNQTVLEKYQYCSVEKTRHCRQKVLSGDPRKLLNEISSCHKNCATPCTFCRYNTIVTTLNIHEPPFFDFRSYKLNYSHWRPIWFDFSVVQIFYTDFSVEMIQSAESMSIHDVIGNVGGQVNLWIGVSMFTLTQIPAILVFVLCFYLWHKHMHREVKYYAIEIDSDHVKTNVDDSKRFRRQHRNRNRKNTIVLQETSFN